MRDVAGGGATTSRGGSWRIEFEKGKAAIAVGSLEKQSGVIDTLIKAVRAGELDEQIGQSTRFGRPIPGRNPEAKSADAPADIALQIAGAHSKLNQGQRLSSAIGRISNIMTN